MLKFKSTVHVCVKDLIEKVRSLRLSHASMRSLESSNYSQCIFAHKSYIFNKTKWLLKKKVMKIKKLKTSLNNWFEGYALSINHLRFESLIKAQRNQSFLFFNYDKINHSKQTFGFYLFIFSSRTNQIL